MTTPLSNQLASSVRAILDQDSDGNVTIANSEIVSRTYVYTNILGEE